MYRKLLKIFLCLFVIILFSLFFHFRKYDYEVTYNINNYSILEKYDDYYQFVIKSGDGGIYFFDLLQKFSNKRMISDIKLMSGNNLVCINPIYKNHKNDDIYCLLDNLYVSNYYLLKNGNKDFLSIIKKNNISVDKYNESSLSKDYKNIKVYQKNIADNNIFIIWNYNGFYVLNNKKLSYKKIIDYDLYDNVMSTISGNYFVLFNNNSVNGIDKLYYYNFKDDKVRTFKINVLINKDSYINGVYNNIIYVTDRKAKKQFAIDIYKKSINLVGSEDLKYIGYDNDKKLLLDKNVFFKSDYIFSNKKIVSNDITSSDNLVKYGKYYYFFEGNKFYKSLNNYKKLLFELDNIKYFYIYNDNIVVVADKSLYLYNDSGLKKILDSNELKYNYDNICKIWEK